jgi:hypothetical protein
MSIRFGDREWMARCVGRIREWQPGRQVVEGRYVVGYVKDGIWSEIPESL